MSRRPPAHAVRVGEARAKALREDRNAVRLRREAVEREKEVIRAEVVSEMRAALRKEARRIDRALARNLETAYDRYDAHTRSSTRGGAKLRAGDRDGGEVAKSVGTASDSKDPGCADILHAPSRPVSRTAPRIVQPRAVRHNVSGPRVGSAHEAAAAEASSAARDARRKERMRARDQAAARNRGKKALRAESKGGRGNGPCIRLDCFDSVEHGTLPGGPLIVTTNDVDCVAVTESWCGEEELSAFAPSASVTFDCKMPQQTRGPSLSMGQKEMGEIVHSHRYAGSSTSAPSIVEALPGTYQREVQGPGPRVHAERHVPRPDSPDARDEAVRVSVESSHALRASQISREKMRSTALARGAEASRRQQASRDARDLASLRSSLPAPAPTGATAVAAPSLVRESIESHTPRAFVMSPPRPGNSRSKRELLRRSFEQQFLPSGTVPRSSSHIPRKNDAAVGPRTYAGDEDDDDEVLFRSMDTTSTRNWRSSAMRLAVREPDTQVRDDGPSAAVSAGAGVDVGGAPPLGLTVPQKRSLPSSWGGGAISVSADPRDLVRDLASNPVEVSTTQASIEHVSSSRAWWLDDL